MSACTVLDRLDAFLPSLATANDELAVKHAADPSSVNVEHVEDDTAQHIEMVRARAVEILFAFFFAYRRMRARCDLRDFRVQDLSCGLFEMKPKEEQREVSLRPSDAAVGKEGESDEEDDGAQLQLPPYQTSAVAAAQRAGRTLISEVVEAGAPEPAEGDARRGKKRGGSGS